MTACRTPRFVALHTPDAPALAREIVAGLGAPAAALPPKLFYDELGSRLFDAITALDEYYPTRVEAAVLSREGEVIAQAVHSLLGERWTLLDLGAGDGAKAARLFPLLRPARYVAVDISTAYLREALARLQREHPTLAMTGVGLDFARALALPPELLDEEMPRPGLVFYPGSSIGNFTPPEALRLLREARATSRGGALLVGVDLVKDRAVLEAAYDDPLGVTAAFNLNLLRHVNRLIETDFALREWRHVAFFDPAASRIEMHLEARQPLEVRWRQAGGGVRRFATGERIHTENSYKWRADDFAALLRDAGFARVQRWTDERGWFAVMLASG